MDDFPQPQQSHALGRETPERVLHRPGELERLSRALVFASRDVRLPEKQQRREPLPLASHPPATVERSREAVDRLVAAAARHFDESARQRYANEPLAVAHRFVDSLGEAGVRAGLAGPSEPHEGEGGVRRGFRRDERLAGSKGRVDDGAKQAGRRGRVSARAAHESVIDENAEAKRGGSAARPGRREMKICRGEIDRAAQKVYSREDEGRPGFRAGPRMTTAPQQTQKGSDVVPPAFKEPAVPLFQLGRS